MTETADISVIMPLVLVAAFILDLIVGDPEWMPHPVRWTGRSIYFIERLLRRYARSPRARRGAGAVLAVVIAGSAFLVSAVALYLSLMVSTSLLFMLSVYIAWTSISVKALKNEAEAVLVPFVAGDIVGARTRLKRIVGRDTGRLDEKGVLKATAETVAENTSDGIVAPIFYLAAGGPAVMLLARLFGSPAPETQAALLVAGGPALMAAYKAVNTLDSMVGYKNEEYVDIGRFSARLDDLANYIPSRLTAALMVIASFLLKLCWRRSIEVVLRDGRKHPSPNAGLPEAALAGALGLKFGGPMSYGGVVLVKPHIGDDLKTVSPGTVTTSIRIMLLTAFLMAAISLVGLVAATFLI